VVVHCTECGGIPTGGVSWVWGSWRALKAEGRILWLVIASELEVMVDIRFVRMSVSAVRFGPATVDVTLAVPPEAGCSCLTVWSARDDL